VLSQFSGVDPLPRLLLLATSTVTLVFQVRPFSNSAESAVLALSLIILLWYPHGTLTPRRLGITGILLGVTFALGFFTRVTFLFFAFPVGVGFLWRAGLEPTPQRERLLFHGKQVALSLLAVFGSAALASLAFATFDSLYFGSLEATVQGKPLSASDLFSIPSLGDFSLQGSLTWTPINNLRYNLDEKNLALHTLHPRYLHALVNLPLMFGPLGLAGLFSVFLVLLRRRWLSRDLPRNVCFFSGLLGLLLLSAAPHQEPRFLVAMLLPLVVSVGSFITSKTSFWYSWTLFNTATLVLFGVLHQGGLLPLINELHQDLAHINGCAFMSNNSGRYLCDYSGSMLPGIETQGPAPSLTTKVFFLQTYMPPHHLFGINARTHQAESSQDHIRSRVEITDLFGASVERLQEELKTWEVAPDTQDLTGDKFVFQRQPDGVYLQILVVAPAVVSLESQIYSFTPLITVPGHLSMEHLGDYQSPSNLDLIAYRVTHQSRLKASLPSALPL